MDHLTYHDIGLVGISGSPSKFSALDWTDFKDDYGLIAGGTYPISTCYKFLIGVLTYLSD